MLGDLNRGSERAVTAESGIGSTPCIHTSHIHTCLSDSCLLAQSDMVTLLGLLSSGPPSAATSVANPIGL